MHHVDTATQMLDKKERRRRSRLMNWIARKVLGQEDTTRGKKGWKFEEGKLSLAKLALSAEVDVREYGHLHM